ncbi:MAG: hypothetical protein QG599_1752 [Pseudomonadota bacterium]|nr:hypothetical protein [Pseudomonadota bacterium]
MNVMSIGAATVHAGMEDLKQNAHKIAVQSIQPLNAVGEQAPGQNQQQTPKADLIEPLVEQNEITYQVKAGVFTLQTANNMFNTLLGIA